MKREVERREGGGSRGSDGRGNLKPDQLIGRNEKKVGLRGLGGRRGRGGLQTDWRRWGRKVERGEEVRGVWKKTGRWDCRALF